MISAYKSDIMLFNAKFSNKYSPVSVNAFEILIDVCFGKAMNICMINDSYIGFLLHKYVTDMMA